MEKKAMWTMVAENGYKHHLAESDFISLCGRRNFYVGTYVEYINGEVRRVGEGRQVFEAISEMSICKKCLNKLTNPDTTNNQ